MSPRPSTPEYPKIEGARCPACEVQHTGIAASTTSAMPKGGDLSICAYCATPAYFTGVGYESRLLTDAELRELAADVDVQATIAGMQNIIDQRGGSEALIARFKDA